MRELGVFLLLCLILDENNIYRLNLRKVGISFEFDGGKWGKYLIWTCILVKGRDKIIYGDCRS